MAMRTHGAMRRGRWLAAGLLLATAFAQSNVLSNPGFEEERSGLPSGWSLDQNLRSKGSARLDTNAASGRFALELAPNGRNTDSNHLFGFGQLIPARDLAGRRVQLRAAVKAAGGATAVVLAFAVGPGFQPLGNVMLEQPGPTSGFEVQSQSMEVDRNAAQVLVACAVKGTSGRAWFDDVSFGLETGGGQPVPARGAEAAEASLAIDVSQVIRSIPRTLYGTNVEWINNGNGVWDAAQNRPKPAILAAAKDLGVSLVRFPGGIFADYYHWRDGVGPSAQRPVRSHVADSGKSGNAFGTDELVRFCRMIGAEPLLEVNIVTGSPQEAADWVRYCNAPGNRERARNGSSEPYRVHYWEIGNEPYGKPGNRATAASSMTPQEFARRYLAFASAMKQADPSIVLLASGGHNTGKYIAVTDDNWDRVLLQTAAPQMDYLAVHDAYGPLWASASRASFDDVYRALLAFPTLISQNLDAVAAQVRTYGGGKAGRIQLAVTEWGPLFHILPLDPWVGHTKTMGSALFAAGAMQAFLRSPQTSLATFFKLTEASFMGWIDANGDPKPSYYALQMYTHHFGSELVRVDASGPTFDSPEVGNIARLNDVPLLDAVASLSSDHKRLSLIVVNRGTTTAVNTSIRIRGMKPRPEARGWVLAASSLDANNGNDLPSVPGLQWARQKEAPRNAMFYQGRPGTVITREIASVRAGESFSYTFPPISVTALELTQ